MTAQNTAELKQQRAAEKTHSRVFTQST